MSALDTILKWISPILSPFKDLPTHLNAMQQNHLDSVKAFHGTTTALMAAPALLERFSGPAADVSLQYTESLVASENLISGVAAPVAEVATATTTCATEVEGAAETLAVAAEGESTVLEAAAALDIASVAQAGLDPLTDIPGIILTIVAGAMIIGALVTFGWAIYDAVKAWEKIIHDNDQPYSNPPKINPVQPPQNSLTDEQEKLAEKLFKDFGHLGLSLDDIRAIIANNPHLTEAQLRALLSRYADVIAKNPTLVQKHGALAVFQMFVALSSYDPAHGGNYATRTPVATLDDLLAGTEEAEVEMGVMEEGKAAWPFVPSTDPSYEATDGNGQKWDAKGYRTVDTNGNAFDPEKTLKKMQKDFNKDENIILDTRKLTQKEIDDLQKVLKRNKQDNRVLWWPDEPTP